MVTKRHDHVIKSKLHRPLCGRQAILSRPVRHPNVRMDRRSHGYSVLLRPGSCPVSRSDLAQEMLGRVFGVADELHDTAAAFRQILTSSPGWRIRACARAKCPTAKG